MKKIFNKIKVCLVAFRIALISFPLKVKGVKVTQPGVYYPSELYWVPSPAKPTDISIKLIPRLLIAITFIVWIVSFLKIRKIDDKTLKKKKIKKTIIIISLLAILIISTLLLLRFLNR